MNTPVNAAVVVSLISRIVTPGALTAKTIAVPDTLGIGAS